MSIPSLSKLFPVTVLALSVITFTGCSSDDDDDTGLIKFYNADLDSPDLFLTLDEDLDEDDDDEFEATFSGVGFGEASSATSVPVDDYFYEVAFQDDDSALRDDLEIIDEGTLSIDNEELTFIISTGTIENPVVSIFEIEVEDSDDLIEDDEFQLQIINVHPTQPAVDVYFSETDETFNEAQLLATANSLVFTDPINLEEDEYIIYLTLPGETDVIFESDDVSYLFNTQYFLAIRQNDGAGGNPFQLDNMTFTGLETISDTDSLATIRFYNGVHEHESLPDYSGQVDLSLENVSTDTVILNEQLALGEISDSTITNAEDFSLDVTDSANGDFYIESAVFSVPENTARTIFFYVDEEDVDEDDDGVVDEDEDGIVDEIEAFVRTVVVDDDTSNGSVETTVSVVNLADNDDFSFVTVSFVDSDETLDDVDDVRSVSVGNSSDISLLNNTYDVFAVATIDNQDIILDSFTLTLNEDSNPQFLLLEFDETSPSGFSLNLIDQGEQQTL